MTCLVYIDFCLSLKLPSSMRCLDHACMVACSAELFPAAFANNLSQVLEFLAFFPMLPVALLLNFSLICPIAQFGNPLHRSWEL